MNNIQLYLSIGIPTLTSSLPGYSADLTSTTPNDKVDKLGDALRTEMLAFRREVAADMSAS